MTEDSRWQDDFRILSETEAGHQVLDVILRKLGEFHWGSKDIFAIHLALEEALINAIRHGNCSCHEKTVVIHTEITPAHFLTRITDEGPGFDPQTLPDPTAEEFLECPCGRGVKLMQNYMTSVTFNDTGNEVTLEKTCTKIR